MMEKFGFGGKREQGGHHPHHFPPVPPVTLEVVQAPEASIVLDNVLAVPHGTFHDGQYVIVDRQYVFTARVSRSLPPGRLGAGGTQREWARWPSQGKQVLVEPYDVFSGNSSAIYLGIIELEIDFFSRNNMTSQEYQQGELVAEFLNKFRDQILAPGQIIVLKRGNVNFKVTVTKTEVMDLQGGPTQSQRRGILLPQTDVGFVKSPNSLLNLRGSSRARTNLFQPNFDFKSMGIGGLDKQFMTILRRAFVTRMAAPQDIERLGITHIKGMLLFGPPGTGKTLIARQIGKMLNAVEPKIVNGPEMLSKYVGASEENIRKLFKDAEDEYRAKGDDSNLHIIIFDELDAVFKQRGGRGDGTGVGDNVVNQLLSKMDGVNQLNNILVIGMTNRKDLIDQALMRPGRFEIQLEIPLPDEAGRKQIFVIHTARMSQEGILGADVNLEELASLTKNYSGAEIAGVVRAASQYALTRKTSTKDGKVTYDTKRQLVITREDFLRALDDVRPAFGVSEEQLQRLVDGGIVPYSEAVQHILAEGRLLVEAVPSHDRRLMSALYSGPSGSGKTALAASVALDSQWPFAKILSPNDMIGMHDQQKIAYIQQVFNDAYRSERSVILIDEIESIIEWSDVGPRFSNSVFIALRTLIRARPLLDHPLLVLATTSRLDILEKLQLGPIFTERFYVNVIPTLDGLFPIFQARNFLTDEEQQLVLSTLARNTGGRLGLGVKPVLDVMTSCLKTADPANAFIHKITELVDDGPL